MSRKGTLPAVLQQGRTETIAAVERRRRFGSVTTFAVAVILSLGLSSASIAQPGALDQGSVASNSEWSSSLAEWIAPYVERQDFSGIIAVANSGTVVANLAVGFADRARGREPTVDTPFAVGSVSKQFTGVAMAILEQRGDLSLEAKVSRYLPEFSHGDSITVGHLLEHKSGLVDIYSLPSYRTAPDTSLTLASVVEQIDSNPLIFTPGSSYAYSNSGYAVAARIVESISGLRFCEFIQVTIFDPLGMTTSGCLEDHVPVELAVGYDPIDQNGLTIAPLRSKAFLIGSGSVYSTATDLAKWAAALQDGSLLDPAASERVLRRKETETSYAYGLTRTERSDRPVVCHDGRLAGYSSDLAIYVNDPVCIIVLGNVQSVARDDLRFAASDLYFGIEPAAPRSIEWAADAPSASAIRELAGSYSFGPGLVVKAFEQGGRLFARANEGEDSEFVLREDGRFFSRTLYSTVRFERDEENRVVAMHYGSGSGEWRGPRVN